MHKTKAKIYKKLTSMRLGNNQVLKVSTACPLVLGASVLEPDFDVLLGEAKCLRQKSLLARVDVRRHRVDLLEQPNLCRRIRRPKALSLLFLVFSCNKAIFSVN